MDQCRRLQCLTGPLIRQLTSRELTQFVIHERQQLLHGVGIAVA
jgi:hypothetical protein